MMSARRRVIRRPCATGFGHRHGFTLMELVVAISVSVLMLALISRIFFDTTQAISRGITISDATQISRAISQQLHEDAENMIGPNDSPAGFLVIVQERMSDRYVRADRVSLPPGMANASRDVRSDQLVFFITEDMATARSLVPPGGGDSFASTTINDLVLASEIDAFNGEARVWYGHLQRSDTALDAAPMEGDPDYFATDWVLGRQALWLIGASDDYGVGTNEINSGAPNFFTYHLPNIVLAKNGDWDIARAVDSSVTHYGLAAWTNESDGLLSNVDPERYPYEAGGLTYVGANRLRVRTSLPSGSSVTRSEIAQMHAYLAAGISDFVVDFAGDYDATSGIDRTSEGDIIWYGHPFLLPPGFQFDPYVSDTESPADTGAFEVFDSIPPSGSNGPYYFQTPSSAMFVFRHDRPDTWPHLIRIRYRVHDRHGRLRSGDDHHGMWFEQIIKVKRPG